MMAYAQKRNRCPAVDAHGDWHHFQEFSGHLIPHGSGPDVKGRSAQRAEMRCLTHHPYSRESSPENPLPTPVDILPMAKTRGLS